MTNSPTSKPKKRSGIRFIIGKMCFSLRRHAFWALSGIKFSSQTDDELPFMCFAHETPLLRELKDVDMYLQHNKIVNLKIAIQRINKVTLFPGETFSYWKLIGKPTKRKGYLKGLVLKNGTLSDGIGGGLCQLSNLIYWMTIHTPLTVVERHRHDYDVFPDSNRTQPFGSGATCFYNYGDLMIRNETELTFQLTLKITDTHLHGAWASNCQPAYTYEVYEKSHVMQSEFWGGYTRHNLLYRKKCNADGLVTDDEFIVENHAIMMYSPYITEGLA